MISATALQVAAVSLTFLVAGIAAGLVTGGTGVSVVPAVPYLQALDLKKEDLIQALGLSFTVSTVALAIGLARQSAFVTDDIRNSFLPSPVHCLVRGSVNAYVAASVPRPCADGSLFACWRSVFNCYCGISFECRVGVATTLFS
jgi:hypothetical protein